MWRYQYPEVIYSSRGSALLPWRQDSARISWLIWLYIQDMTPSQPVIPPLTHGYSEVLFCVEHLQVWRNWRSLVKWLMHKTIVVGDWGSKGGLRGLSITSQWLAGAGRAQKKRRPAAVWVSCPRDLGRETKQDAVQNLPFKNFSKCYMTGSCFWFEWILSHTTRAYRWLEDDYK